MKAIASQISRRNALKSLMAASTVALPSVSLFAEEAAPVSVPTKRMAIIGGGMGGISTAYFCDPEFKIDLFESKAQLGGNALTTSTAVGAKDHSLDLGAQFFHPNTHPIYWSLLQELGVLDPNNADSDLVIELPATLSVFDGPTNKSRFTSTQPFENLNNAIGFANFTKIARESLSTLSWETTVEDWINSIQLDQKFKDEILFPWLVSIGPADINRTKAYSAKSLLLLFVKTFPENMMAAPSTYNSTIGLGGYLQLLANRCKNLTVHLKTPVLKVEQEGENWFVTTEAGREGPYTDVVVNAPPFFSKNFLKDLSPELYAVLDRFETFDVRIVLHKDPAYVIQDKKYWCSHNAAAEVDNCEGSVWMGSGQPDGIQVFKSWANSRPQAVKEPIAESSFTHSQFSANTLQAARELNGFPLPKGLHLAGHYTTGFELQESALYSGLKLSRSLAPDSSALKAFEERLKKDGQSETRYELN